MNAPDTSPSAVGRQLARRREDLDVTQEELAQRIGIAARTVSAIETGLNRISRGKRAAWEAALELKAGTISRAYRDGTPIQAEGGELAGSQDGMPGDESQESPAGQMSTTEKLQRSSALLDEIEARLRDTDEREQQLILGMLQVMQDKQQR
jgi:transcriptional regulator with XRE-family HTH domain